MLHTPLKHAHPAAAVAHGPGHGHAPAQHAQPASTRCTPHGVHASIPAHAHELNLAEWLHMSPAQVAMMSPVAAPYTPPGHLFVPTPSPLQFAVAANANARNDFLSTSPLPYSSPFQVAAHYPHPDPYTANSNFPQAQTQVPTIAISVENTQQLQDPLTETQAGDSSSPGPADASLLLSLATEYFPYASGSAPTSSSSTSPISHRGSPFPYQAYMGPEGEGESTPVTTLSGADSSQAQVQTSAPEDGQMQHLIDRLRGASPVTDVSISTSGSPERPAKAQTKPVESTESPFRIAAPQPRTGSGPFSPLPPSSRPTSALGALSELAELASQRSTPSHPVPHSSLVSPAPQSHPSSRPASRPTSALSARSTVSQVKTPKVHCKQPLPHRFAPSLLRVALPYQQTPTSGSEGHANSRQITPSFVDGLARGPLEFEEEGHRYRTRSKLRSLKAEIQEREREADLLLIRRGLRGENVSAGAEEDKSGLDMLASVSVTRRIGLDSPTRSETPLPSRSQSQKAVRPKRGAKRAFRDLDDGDCESVASSSGSGGRTPSKRPRIITEKAAMAKVKKEPLETGLLRSRTRPSREKAPSRPSPVRAPSQRSKKAASPTKNAKASSTPAAKKSAVKKDVGMEVDESDLSSLSSMSETEDAKSSIEDMDYAPKKSGRSSRSKATPVSVVKVSSTKSAPKTKTPAKAKSTPVDTGNGAAAITIPIRTFAPDVPLHASFPLLYRKFPLCGYTDPVSFSFAPFSGSPSSSSASNGTSGGESGPLPVPSSGHFNAPRSAEDLYTPRFVRGVGRDKMGLCPICYESTERGGAGRAEWLSMKFSAFNYHMQYAHGISPITALPFSPPIAFRSVSRTPNHKNEKSEILEGKCHRCGEWAPVEGVKCVEAKLKEIYWWKHAATCHKGSTMPGECDAHLEDAVSKRVRASFDAMQARAHPTVPVATVVGPKQLFTTAPLY